MLLKTKDVAALLNCGETTVLSLARSGRIRALKVGSHWRFDRRDVEAYLRRSVFEPSESVQYLPQLPRVAATPGLPLLERFCARRGKS